MMTSEDSVRAGSQGLYWNGPPPLRGSLVQRKPWEPLSIPRQRKPAKRHSSADDWPGDWQEMQRGASYFSQTRSCKTDVEFASGSTNFVRLSWDGSSGEADILLLENAASHAAKKLSINMIMRKWSTQHGTAREGAEESGEAGFILVSPVAIGAEEV